MTPPDAEFIRGFLEGESPSVRQIDTWIGEVLRNPRLGLAGDADDLSQQVRQKLLVAFRAGRFMGTATLRTYVWRAAQHAAIDHLRMRRTRPAAVAIDDIAEPQALSDSPETALLRDERRAIFARVLNGLGDACRELFQLIVFDELNYEEIAIRLKTTEGAVKVRALRCREKAVAEYKSVTSAPGPRQLSDVEDK
jgi:RNA polymerase sigma factor (sigma-70 family)